jgi:hypothetical protein
MLHDQVIVNGVLIVVAVVTLTFAYRNLRHHLRRSGDRRPDARPVPRPAPESRSRGPARRPVAVGGPRAGATAWVSPSPRTAPEAPSGPDPRWAALEEAWADDEPGSDSF